jgi:hypothetical protein
MFDPLALLLAVNIGLLFAIPLFGEPPQSGDTLNGPPPSAD